MNDRWVKFRILFPEVQFIKLHFSDKVHSSNTENKNNVKAEYQKKLNDLQSEVKKLTAAKKEHAKLLKNKSDSDRQLRALQSDLAGMKKTKVTFCCSFLTFHLNPAENFLKFARKFFCILFAVFAQA